ncbi:MAG: hypothetical protein AAGN46_05550 [Acidobacteriota bacterium]
MTLSSRSAVAALARSKTVWSSLGTIVASLLQITGVLDLTLEQLLALLATGGGAAGIFGRLAILKAQRAAERAASGHPPAAATPDPPGTRTRVFTEERPPVSATRRASIAPLMAGCVGLLLLPIVGCSTGHGATGRVSPGSLVRAITAVPDIQAVLLETPTDRGACVDAWVAIVDEGRERVNATPERVRVYAPDQREHLLLDLEVGDRLEANGRWRPAERAGQSLIFEPDEVWRRSGVPDRWSQAILNAGQRLARERSVRLHPTLPDC